MGEHKRSTGRQRLTVAVVIPTIPGREALLKRALDSVHAQRRPPDQIIVERDSERTGAAASRNRALERVTSDVVAFLDDDDFLKETHISSCVRELSGPMGYDLVYPRPVMVGGSDPTATTHQGRFPVSPWGLRWCPEFEAHVRHRGSFIPITHVVMTEAVKEIGGFRDGYRLEDGRYRGEDEDYLIRLLDAGYRFGHLDAATWYWFVNPKSTAGKGQRSK